MVYYTLIRIVPDDVKRCKIVYQKYYLNGLLSNSSLECVFQYHYISILI